MASMELVYGLTLYKLSSIPNTTVQPRCFVTKEKNVRVGSNTHNLNNSELSKCPCYFHNCCPLFDDVTY